MKKVLVYPCGTEMGLEILRSLQYAKGYELYGGSSTYDHGRFVYDKHIDNLPFITDRSDDKEILEFNDMIKDYRFDFIYPAMDGVLTVFSRKRELLSPTVVACDHSTATITRSKRKTYDLFSGLIPVPVRYSNAVSIKEFPVFVKPDIGQGSVGARIVSDIFGAESIDFSTEVCMEYLPGPEYTIDCFTNQSGDLIFSEGRCRTRIKGGISVNSVIKKDPVFREYAHIINKTLKQRGGWFFQLKENADGTPVLLEIASRIAGASSITRCRGINLPLMTLDVFNGISIDHVVLNDYAIELDRALYNSYKVDLDYEKIYLDYDDTLIVNNKVNTQLIKLLFQCRNEGKTIILLTKHKGDLLSELKRFRLDPIFDKIICLEQDDKKTDHINPEKAVFIDDSYGERKNVHDMFNIPVFDTHMIECLIHN